MEGTMLGATTQGFADILGALGAVSLVLGICLVIVATEAGRERTQVGNFDLFQDKLYRRASSAWSKVKSALLYILVP
jgi:hypothetical protein